MSKRVFLIVIDSVGIGYLPDAYKYDDVGANTLVNIAKYNNGLNLPTLKKLGLGNIEKIKGVDPVINPLASYGKMSELSVGKDTMTGHWEMMGLLTKKPFITFTETGFPNELIKELEDKTGYKFIGNISASGTEIIKDLGEQHLKTNELIIYTSQDSVLQIAANEKIVPINELYRICSIARKITLKDEWKVGRVIARPFVGDNKLNFTRTANRHDYALKPFDKTVLDSLKENNYDSIGIGKINDIFDGEGITEHYKNLSNNNGMDHIINVAKKDFNGLCFLNLVDFDAIYGHRRNPVGYKDCLVEFDNRLSELIDILKDDDLLIITADHGNDPTFKGTDHTREYVPLLVYEKNLKSTNLGIRESFADIGATIAEIFNIEKPKIGKSFLNEIKRD